MNSAVRNIVAGAQTLRFVTALVLSVSVTTAVAGPMAYQAVEARNAAAASLGASAPGPGQAATSSPSSTLPTIPGPGPGPGSDGGQNGPPDRPGPDPVPKG